MSPMAKALNIHGLYRPGHGATCNVEAFPSQMQPDLARAVDLPIGVENALDLGEKRLVAIGTTLQPGRVGTLCQMVKIGGRGDRQHLPDRFDPMPTPTVVA